MNDGPRASYRPAGARYKPATETEEGNDANVDDEVVRWSSQADRVTTSTRPMTVGGGAAPTMSRRRDGSRRKSRQRHGKDTVVAETALQGAADVRQSPARRHGAAAPDLGRGMRLYGHLAGLRRGGRSVESGVALLSALQARAAGATAGSRGRPGPGAVTQRRIRRAVSWGRRGDNQLTGTGAVLSSWRAAAAVRRRTQRLQKASLRVNHFRWWRPDLRHQAAPSLVAARQRREEEARFA